MLFCRMIKNKHGGIRAGAGCKKKHKVTIAFRIDRDIVESYANKFEFRSEFNDLFYKKQKINLL